MSVLEIVFRPIARTEYDDAADWYEQRRPGLGAAFTDAVQLVLDRIAARPSIHAQVHRDIRKAVVSGYPYCVYNREEPGRVVIVSGFHTSRDPSLWQGRS